jgi:glycosyltransferase involved in cell wall biosynthesis
LNPSAITAFILTRDEERDLPRAITSLPPGMEILVLDARSTDRTVTYAKDAGARVIERDWSGFADARAFGLAQVATPWVLVLDADEALDDVLRDAILEAVDDVDGYAVRRTTYFRGKPMRLWSNESLLRLMRTAAASVEAVPLHEHYLVTGAVRELPGTLLHYSYPDLASYREKYARYTSIEARNAPRDGLRALIELTLLVPRFVRNLVLGGAILDGPRGWYVAWQSARYPLVVACKALFL